MRIHYTLHFVVAVLLAALAGCSTAAPIPMGEFQDGQQAEHGGRLAQGLAACGFCHGSENSPDAPLSGGREVYDRYGKIYASNVTPGRGGVGGQSPAQLLRVLRQGAGEGDRRLSPQVHRGYEWMSDDDALAVISYLKQLPPADNQVPRRQVSLWARNSVGMFESQLQVEGLVPPISRKYADEFGRYLVDHVARCSACHNGPDGWFTEADYLGGGSEVKTEAGVKSAPALAGSEHAAGWGREKLLSFLKTGRAPDGRQIDARFCPTKFFSRAQESDLQALAGFLESLGKQNVSGD